jgi:hypothetical protein
VQDLAFYSFVDFAALGVILDLDDYGFLNFFLGSNFIEEKCLPLQCCFNFYCCLMVIK